jgi:hypothetical protein
MNGLRLSQYVGEVSMNFAFSKLPIVFVLLGAILIGGSFAWQKIKPPTKITMEQISELQHAASEKHAPTPSSRRTITTEVSEARRIEAQKAVERELFMRNTVPMLARYIGATLAALGCILYPVQLLIRQAQAEAAKEEEDSATVVE